MGSTGERGAEQWRGQYCFSTDWRCVTLNCFTVCSSAVWLPEKYAAMALWNRISCWCITFSCISNRHTTLSLKPHLNIRHFIYTHCTHSYIHTCIYTLKYVIITHLWFNGIRNSSTTKSISSRTWIQVVSSSRLAVSHGTLDIQPITGTSQILWW